MMEFETPLNFGSKEDEVQYWMNIANEMYQKKLEVEQEMLEYQENSLIIEKELETSYEQTDKLNRELNKKIVALTDDMEKYKDHYKQQVAAYTTLKDQIIEIKNENEDLLQFIRKLEQDNDDLEQNNRELKMSEEEKEEELNMMVEKLAIVETENYEKDIIIQRLKDENKDLQQQIKIDALQQNTNENIASGIQRLNSMRLTMRPSVKRPINRRSVIINNQPVDNENIKIYDQVEDNNIFQYVRELEKKIKNLEKAQRSSKDTEEEINAKYNTALEKIALLETELNERENQEIIIQSLKDKNKALTEKVKIKIETAVDDSEDCILRISPIKDEKRKSSSSSFFKIKMKKVKDEEKHHRSLMSFLKRLRHSRSNQMHNK